MNKYSVTMDSFDKNFNKNLEENDLKVIGESRHQHNWFILETTKTLEEMEKLYFLKNIKKEK